MFLFIINQCLMNKIKICVLYNDYDKEFYEKTLYNKENQALDEFYFYFEKYDPIIEYGKIVDTLKQLGYEAYQLNIRDDIENFFQDLRKNKPDVIFNFLETIRDDSRLEFCFVGILELLNICYTGARPRALANCQNKILAKKILKANNLSTPNFVEIHNLSDLSELNKINFPALAKPAFQDASVGIYLNSYLKDIEQAKERIKNHFLENQEPLLIEEYIDGREFNVAMLNVQGKIKVFPISEINFVNFPGDHPKIVSFEAKWDPYSQVYHKTIPICPAIIDFNIKKKIIKESIEIFKIFECEDYARIDLRLDAKNQHYFIDINPNPNLEEGTGFLRNASKGKMSPPKVYDAIIKNALQRYKNKLL